MPDSLFERTVKQTLRFLMIDEKLLLDTVSKGHALKNQNMPKTTPGTLYEHIRSPGFLKEFYSNPNYNIDLLLKTERQGLSEKQHKQKNTGIEFTTAQKDIIMNFIKDINTHKPASIQNWITLHHYIYYIYRRFVTVDPSTDKDDIPDVMIKRIRYLLESLLNCDPTQLYIKVFSTVRDFIIAARICSEETHINIKEPLRYLSTFLTYYNALCAAAQKLTTVIPEFDRLLSFYNFNWLRFNKMLFYTYFFKSISVQNKLNEIEKQQMGCSVSHEKLRESYGLFLDDMNQTNGAWMTQTLRIENISKNLNSEDFKNDLNVCDREATLLYVNYWVSRSFEQKKYEINLNRFVGYLLSWMGNITNMAPSLVDHKGRCQCEECVLEQFITYNSDDDFSSTFVRYIKCDLCRTNCILEKFAAHLNNHHSENNTHPTKWHLNSKLDQEQAIKNVSSKVCKVLSETIEDLRVNSAYLKKQAMKGAQTLKIAEGADCVIQTVPNTRERLESFNTPFDCVLKDPVFSLDRQATTEPIIKIASEPPLFKDSHVMDISSLANCETNYKMSFQDFVKEKCDETTENCLRFDAFLKNAEEMAKSDCKKDLADIKDKIRKCEDLAAAKISIDDNKLKKCVPNTTTETELKDTAQSKTSRSSNHSCNHNCKHDELGLAESKKGCHSNCDHHKEARKCDCTYCEVFGTTMPSHFHKANETRDRLRSRLNQRKERHENLRSCIDKTPNPLPYPNLNKPNSVNNNGDTNSGTVINAPTNKSSAKTNVTKPNIVPFERVPNMANLISPPEKPGNKTPPVVTPSNNAETCSLQPSISSLSTSSLNSLCKDNSRDSRDINDLLDFIEGNRKNFRKIVLAEKKAAKKARQKLKKEEERLRFEKEEREKEEQRIREQKRLEEEQMRAEALAKQFVEKLKKNKNKTVDSKLQTQKQNNSKSKKNKNCKNNDNAERQLIEETIPAMVTIKRVVENNSPPTVTITLKGSTPDQDKLLYTLVNGHTKETNENNNLNAKKNKTSNTTNNNNNNKATNNSDNKESKKSKKKKDKDGVVEKCKELKVTLSVDKICTKVDSKKANNKNKTTENNKASQKQNDKSTTKVNNSKDVGINIPMLRLPPGITITKVDGPINKNCKASSNDNLNQNTNIPVSKSGVIVVDTEKLIQNKSASASTSAATNNKKNKKKKNSKNEAANENSKSKKNSSSTPMVTLKNPIFHTLQTTLASKTGDKSTPEVSNIMPCNQQASIIKNENGMVTIRSPRLQHSLTGGAVIPNLLAELKPVIGPEVSTPYLQSCHSNFNEKNVSQFNAQEILSGLPGIEITKVEKRVAKDDGELKKSCQAADVSIIPSNGNDKFYFDKDDWPFESVFTPKDILEDDLDAEERELEAFKRFCQQSVPPKRKEKVTHLNVKDIILMKKNDYAFN